MPFIALHKDTRERIDITTIENPRLVLQSGDCICQLCDTPMIIKAGQIIRAHFAHGSACPTEYESHPESQEHREAKIFLASHLREAFAEYIDAKIEYEVPIPEVKRIADLLATFPMGWRVAHEIQLASITTETLEARTNDYLRAGVDVVWWLGKSANTPANREWSRKNFGYALCLNIH
jgi:competence CoiA-like predicted nuclease